MTLVYIFHLPLENLAEVVFLRIGNESLCRLVVGRSDIVRDVVVVVLRCTGIDVNDARRDLPSLRILKISQVQRRHIAVGIHVHHTSCLAFAEELVDSHRKLSAVCKIVCHRILAANIISDLDRTGLHLHSEILEFLLEQIIEKDSLRDLAEFRVAVLIISEMYSCISSLLRHLVIVEKAFGRKGSPWEALRFTLPDGLEVIVTGQIDRVDSMRDGDAKYVVVIDYKSGRKQLDLSQVFVGLELQLLTYMYVALLNMGEDAVPAAILYCYVRNDKTSLDHVADEEEKKTLYDKKSRLSGYYLDDSQVMTALDTSMEGYSEFLNLRLKKDGTLSNVSHTMYDEAGWQKLLTLAVARIREIAGRIDSGDIAVRPILLGQASPCRYCPYHAVCRFDAQLPDNGYDVVTIRKEDLLEKLDEGGSEHGVDTGTAGGH